METFFIFIIGLALLIAVSVYGGDRNIGSIATFIISLLLSPIVGFLIAWASGSNGKAIERRIMYEEQAKQRVMNKLKEKAENPK